MKRSITSVGLTLGAVALLALGTGCRHKEQQPAPNEPSTSAPSEPGAMTTQPGAINQPSQPSQPVRPGNEYGAGLPGEAGQQIQPGTTPGTEAPGPQPSHEMPGAQPSQPGQQGALPGQQGAQGQAQTPPANEPTATAGGNEREMCESIATAAKLHVEDVQNGVAIVMLPRQGTTLSNLRDDAKKLEQTIQEHSQPQAGGEPCGIFALGRLPSVKTSMTEGKSTVRLVMTTTNASEIRDLRRMAREQVGALMQSTKSNLQHQR